MNRITYKSMHVTQDQYTVKGMIVSAAKKLLLSKI